MEKRHRNNGVQEHGLKPESRPVAKTPSRLRPPWARRQNGDARRAVRGLRLRAQVGPQPPARPRARARRADAARPRTALPAHRAGRARDLAGRRTALWQTPGPGPAAGAAARPAPPRQTPCAPARTTGPDQPRHPRPAAGPGPRATAPARPLRDQARRPAQDADSDPPRHLGRDAPRRSGSRQRGSLRRESGRRFQLESDLYRHRQPVDRRPGGLEQRRGRRARGRITATTTRTSNKRTGGGCGNCWATTGWSGRNSARRLARATRKWGGRC